ncbi:Cold-regulated plasma membrane protein 4-like [Forsythia ovata]|uniref:Cold-regulated plasma membrane protein 4-like n=1 Tax=Forsythia ovata TaxID=205694 RepID=A0ABD1UTM5_9LAMI
MGTVSASSTVQERLTAFQWCGTIAAIILLIFNRTGRRSSKHTSLLVIYLFICFPTVLFKILRGQFGRWVAFLAVAANLFFPQDFPASRFLLFVIMPDWLAVELRDSAAVGGILCLIIGVTLVLMEIGQIGLSDWRSSTSGRDKSPNAPSKANVGKKQHGAGVREMRGSLDKKNAPAARQLDKELKRSTTEASMARSKIKEVELEDIRRSYDISVFVELRTLGLEERADDPPEGFIAIYEPIVGSRPFQREIKIQKFPIFSHSSFCGWGKLFGPATLARGAIATRGTGCGAIEVDSSIGSRCSAHAHAHAPAPTPASVSASASTPISASSSGSYPPKDKWKRIAEDTGEAAGQKRKAYVAAEGFMRDARKTRRVEERRQASPDHTREVGDAGNLFASSSHEGRIRITHRSLELDPSVLELLPTHLVVMAASVHKYWTKNTLEGFDGKLSEKEPKSKKLSEDLRTMSLEKAQLESNKRALQFKLDLVVSKEVDMKAKYEIELKATKESLKQARDQKRAVEASQKRAEEAQKLADDREFAVETAVATANNNLEAVVAEKDSLLAEVREELERVNAEHAGSSWLRGLRTHPKWDISFLRYVPNDAPAFEGFATAEIPPHVEDHRTSEAQNTTFDIGGGLHCADPKEAAGL